MPSKFRFRLTWMALLFVFQVFLSPARAAEPGIAGTLSVVPGLGQAVDGKPLEGLGWFLTTTGLFFSRSPYLAQIGFDLWQYNMYDAYQGAGPKKRAKYNVYQNYLAVVNPLNILDPIGAPIVGTAAYYGSKYKFHKAINIRNVVYYGFVGLGEEGLFRGFLFPGFSDLFFGSSLVGATLSSAAFAFAHATGGKENLTPSALGQRFGFGMLMCWQTYRNSYDLRKGIFAHAWYDILLSYEGKITGAKINIPF